MIANYGDKETLSDFLSGQKQISSSYNTFAGECVSQSLRDDMLNILKDEHCIQAELFTEASARGWYAVKQAAATDVTAAKTKFSAC